MPIATLMFCKRCDADISVERRRGNVCWACHLLEKAAYYKKNREVLKAKRKVYYENNRDAIRKQEKERYDNSPKIRQAHLDSAIRSKWGMSADQYRYEYWRLFEMQDGKCAICRKDKKLALDHCHKTGRIRALLCSSCNRVLGFIEEDLEIVEGLRKYIVNNKGRSSYIRP